MFKNIAWDGVIVSVISFGMGLVAIITVAINHNNPKLGDPTPAIALGCSAIGTPVMMWLWYFFSKKERKPEPKPDSYPKEEHKELTTSYH